MDVRVPLETTVVAVWIMVIVTVKVVVLRYVAVVRVMVGKTVDRMLGTPSTVYVDSDTTMDEIVMTVGSGISAIVWLSTTVSYVEIGKVSVLVIDNGDVDGALLWGVTVVSAGVKVATDIEGRLVGNGWAEDMPSVCSVVMTKPVVLATLSIPSVEDGV